MECIQLLGWITNISLAKLDIALHLFDQFILQIKDLICIPATYKQCSIFTMEQYPNR